MLRKHLSKRFRNKLLLCLLFLTLVPLVVWTLLVYRGSLQDHTKLLEHQLMQSAQIVDLHAEHWYQKNQTMLNFLVREIALHQSRKDWPSILQNLVLSEPHVYVAQIANVQGQQVARSDGRPFINIGDRDYFQKALMGEFNSEPIIGKVYKKPSLCSAGPIHIGGRIQFVATVCSFMQQMGKAIGATQISRTGTAFLIDQTGRVLAHPKVSFLQRPNSPHETALIKRALVGEIGRIELTVDETRYIAFIFSLSNGWRSLALQTREEIFDLSRETLKGPLKIGLVLVLLLFILTYFFIDRVTSPLHRLAEIVRRFGQGDLEARAFVESRDELGLLAKNFNRMAIQIRATIQELRGKEKLLAKHRDELRQKVVQQSQKLLYSAKMSSLGEMAGGIAHEINNPLAIISLRAQRMQEGLTTGTMTTEEARDIAAQIEKTCLRITQIIRGLRTFSRDGSRDPMIEENLLSIISEAENLCSESLRNRRIDLKITCPANLSLQCQPVQLSQVFLNLLMNSRDAVSLLPQKWIHVEGLDQGSHVLIRVTDSGLGIHEPARSQIMQPFFTTKAVGEGTGLGLPICKGIVEQHQGAITLNIDSRHTQFLISLPRKQKRLQAPTRPGRQREAQA